MTEASVSPTADCAQEADARCAAEMAKALTMAAACFELSELLCAHESSPRPNQRERQVEEPFARQQSIDVPLCSKRRTNNMVKLV